MNDAHCLRRDNQSYRRRNLFGFSALAALALLLLAMGFNVLRTLDYREQVEEWHVHSLQVLLVAERLDGAIGEVRRSGGGFLLTGEPQFLGTYRKGADHARALARHLSAITRDNAWQRAHVAALNANLSRLLAHVDRAVRTHPIGGHIDPAELRSGRAEADAAGAALQRLRGVEITLLKERRRRDANAHEVARVADMALLGLSFVFLVVVAWAGITAVRARTRLLDLQQALHRAANTDELTGLANRRAFLRELGTALEGGLEPSRPLALAILDIDHFKHVNDRFGHHAGDQVLHHVAATLRAALRPGDLVGRLGGEEFGVLMAGAAPADARRVGERLRRAVGERPALLEDGTAVAVTISIGVARSLAGERGDALMVRADKALYDAKDAGRNRTRLAA